MQHGDIVDRANDLAEKELQVRLDAIRQQANSRPVYTGTCRYCDDAVPEPQTFCADSDCRDLYQREIDARKRNGQSY